MGLFWIILAIIVISTVVGAVSKMFNNLNEANNNNAARPRAQAAPPRAAGGGGGGGPVRQANSDMDRFLAEIDRLRKKSADAPPPQQKQAPVVPVVQPAKQPDRPRPRVVAELAEPPKTDAGFSQSFPAAVSSQAPRAEVPSAMVVAAPPSGTGAPATRVTRLATRPRAVAKTPFAKNLTGLLNSSQGLAMAIVLQEVLGPPKMKKKGR